MRRAELTKLSSGPWILQVVEETAPNRDEYVLSVEVSPDVGLALSGLECFESSGMRSWVAK